MHSSTGDPTARDPGKNLAFHAALKALAIQHGFKERLPESNRPHTQQEMAIRRMLFMASCGEVKACINAVPEKLIPKETVVAIATLIYG